MYRGRARTTRRYCLDREVTTVVAGQGDDCSMVSATLAAVGEGYRLRRTLLADILTRKNQARRVERDSTRRDDF